MSTGDPLVSKFFMHVTEQGEKEFGYIKARVNDEHYLVENSDDDSLESWLVSVADMVRQGWRFWDDLQEFLNHCNFKEQKTREREPWWDEHGEAYRNAVP